MKIDISGVKAVLGASTIIENIDLSVSGKELIGIIGPNGSGKSTLLKCLYRALKPAAGAIALDGVRLSEIPVRESAKKISVVAQHNFYNFEFSVEEVVLMGRSPYKKAMERDNAEDYQIVREALEQVGMADLAHRSFSTLSGGEQQRVIVARALAQQTPCLILDEPTNHLDIKYQLQLMDIIKKLDKTVIAAIHDLNIAAMYCDKIYVMKQGAVVAFGTPEEVLTEQLIKEVYEVSARVMKDLAGVLRILYWPSAHQKEQL